TSRYTALRVPPTSPLFPYTTLFRSDDRPREDRRHAARFQQGHEGVGRRAHGSRRCLGGLPSDSAPQFRLVQEPSSQLLDGTRGRSEEHTSELQSRENLVCRLLLEKK